MARAHRPVDGGQLASAVDRHLHLHCSQPCLDRPRVPDRDLDMARLWRDRRGGGKPRVRPSHVGRLLDPLPAGPAAAVGDRRRGSRDRRGRRFADLGAAGTDDHVLSDLRRAVLAARLSQRPEPGIEVFPAGHGPVGQPAWRLGDRVRVAWGRPRRRAHRMGLGSVQFRSPRPRQVPRHHHGPVGRRRGGDPARFEPLPISVPDSGERRPAEADRRVVLTGLPSGLPAAVRGNGLPSHHRVRSEAPAALRVFAHAGRARARAPVGPERGAFRGDRDAGDDQLLLRLLEGNLSGARLEVRRAAAEGLRRGHGSCSRGHRARDHAAHLRHHQSGQATQRGDR